MPDNDNIVTFERKPAAAEMSEGDREVIMATLANMLDFQEKTEAGMVIATRVIAELQSHVRDFEREVAALKKAQPKKPVILNSQGARAN